VNGDMRETASMLRCAGIVALTLSLLPLLQAQTSPFAGRWDFNIRQSNGLLSEWFSSHAPYERAGTEPPERAMGSIYGRLAPSPMLPRKPGEWESFDVTLVGRTVTVVRDPGDGSLTQGAYEALALPALKRSFPGTKYEGSHRSCGQV
jgi:hypothetical protein